MTYALTPAQSTLLRRIADGAGLPPPLLRVPGLEGDVARLRDLRLFAHGPGEPALTAAGATLLRQQDAAHSRSMAGSVHFMHGADQSISAEYRGAREQF